MACGQVLIISPWEQAFKYEALSNERSARDLVLIIISARPLLVSNPPAGGETCVLQLH